jgi:type II secretory pathway component PulL
MREFFNPPPVFIEIAPASLKALREEGGIELPLERAADGKLTAACREKTVAALQNFVGRKSWQLRVRAVCGISLHGVSLRKISLPAATGDELERVLRLQIENEFPLPPDDLAWGWREISLDAARLEAVVVAIRRETIEDYDGLLSAAGLAPEFTVAAFARNLLCPAPDGLQAVLEIGRNYCELALFERGVSVGLKILPLPGDLAGSVLKNAPAKTIYVSGTAAQNEVFEKLSAHADCRRLEIAAGAGSSAATLGLKKSVALEIPLLPLRSKPGPAKTKFNLPQLDFSEAESRRWLLRGAALLVLLLVFPFAEALLLKPLLARKLDTLTREKQEFVSLAEPEMQFLESLKQSQPPYLDALYVFSKAAPPGLHLDSLTMDQHGDIQVRATMQSADQVMDFRSKLIASGFFANITVEEQSPNQQKVSVRMTAQWKSAGLRPAVKIDPSPDEVGKSNVGGGANANVGDGNHPPGIGGIPQS